MFQGRQCHSATEARLSWSGGVELEGILSWCKLKASLVRPTDSHLLVLQAEAQVRRCLFWRPFSSPFLWSSPWAEVSPLSLPFPVKDTIPIWSQPLSLLHFFFILNFPKLFSDLHMHSLDPTRKPKMQGKKIKQNKLPNLVRPQCHRDQCLLVSLHFNLFTSDIGMVLGPRLFCGVGHSISRGFLPVQSGQSQILWLFTLWCF